jgi:cation-transporting ATPase E
LTRALRRRAPTSRTVGEIVRANVVTRFNAILGTLLAVILVVGPIQDALFGIVLVSNAAIGIFQELRAKRTLDRLALIAAGDCVVVRDGERLRVGVDEVVVGDVVLLAPGDQIVADGVVEESAGLEIDESLLSGEAVPVGKEPGDEVLSGSFVVAGVGSIRTTLVGPDSYGERLATEARRFVPTRSELRGGIDAILRIVTWMLLPAAGILIWSQADSNESTREAISGSVAGIGSMIPEGLVLLTSLASAVGIVRLGRRRVLVSELSALEGLARVDVLCIDKTGTITSSGLDVVGIEEFDDDEARPAIAALAAADPSPNPTMRAIAGALPAPESWTALDVVPFSSARKRSTVTFADHGTWAIGAPDVLLPRGHALLERARAMAAVGQRVLLAGREVDGEVVPGAFVVLEERVRPDAAETLRWFADQGVTVKVISGDHPETVAAVAARAGLSGPAVDARDIEDFDALIEDTAIFGRVVPEQKRAIVGALQRAGHVVAMTGDGVNDVLAMKDADLGVAMGSGASAARAVAPVVLLDDAFSSLPAVVAEGRRTINNVERVANLFLTKTVYAFILAVTIAIAGFPFPFLPRHLTIISSLTIGIPAFFLALAPSGARVRPGFVRRVLRFAFPAGIVAAAATFLAYALAREEPGTSTTEARTTATIVLFAVATQVLLILARPMTHLRRLLVLAMIGAFALALALPFARDFFALDLPDQVVAAAAVGVASVAIAGLDVGWRFARRFGRNGAGGTG